MTALRKQMFRVCLLKISAADCVAGNLRRNGEHGNSAAMAIVEAVDQMEIARAAASGTHRQLFCQLCFRAGSERRCFFVSDRYPFQIFPRTNGIGKAVESITDQSVHSLHAILCQRFDTHNRSPSHMSVCTSS